MPKHSSKQPVPTTSNDTEDAQITLAERREQLETLKAIFKITNLQPSRDWNMIVYDEV